MAVSIVTSVTGTNTAGSSTQASQSGDMFVALAYRDGSSTPATTPSGWTDINTATGGSASLKGSYQVATGSTTDIAGTWTNATNVIIVQFRGGGALSIGASNGTQIAGNPQYTALTLNTPPSYVLGLCGHKAANLTDIETPPTGMTFITSQLNATASSAFHWSNGTLSSWSTQTVTTSSGQGCHTVVAELIEATSGQDITGSKFTNTNSFGTATVGRGAVAVTGALFSESDSFKTAVLSTTVGITGSLVADADSVKTAVVGSTYPITGALFADGDSFGSAVVSASNGITGSLVVDGDSFGSATIGFPTQTISGSRFVDTDNFGVAVVTSSRNIAGVLYVNPDTFYNAVLTGGVPSAPSGGGQLIRRRRR